MRRKLISIPLVLMIILTTAVATYAMDQRMENKNSDGSVLYKSDFIANSNVILASNIPDGIGFADEDKKDAEYVVPNAGQQVTGEFLNREIVVNGEPIANYESAYPYFVYNKIIYVPITWENCNIFGYKKDVDAHWNVVLTKTAPIQKNYKERWVKNTETTLNAKISGKKITIRNADADGGYDDILLTSEVTQGYPILEYNNVVYIPLTFNVVSNVLGWNKAYDDYSGLYLNTIGTASNETLTNSTTSAYNKSLVNYIRSVNGNISEEEALELVFLVKQKSKIYGIDERLVLAMIQKESTFYDDVEGAGGAVGLMQIMPATGEYLGASEAQLQDPSVNVDVGTKHIAQQINTYGSIDTALVAYNAGGTAVKRGKTSSSYSDTVISYYKNIINATAV